MPRPILSLVLTIPLMRRLLFLRRRVLTLVEWERWPALLATVRAVEVGLDAALTGAVAPGTLVKVADGTYENGGQPIEITADGTAENPIVVTAHNVGAARFKCVVVVRDDHAWLRGFVLDDQASHKNPSFNNNEVGGGTVVYGDRCRVLRCLCLRRNIAKLEKCCLVFSAGAAKLVVAYNTFEHEVSTGTYPRPGAATKYHFNYLFFEVKDGAENTAGGLVTRNLFDGSSGLEFWGGGGDDYESFKTSMLTVGHLDKENYQHTADLEFSWSLFRDMGKESEFSLHCKKMKISYNIFLGKWSKLRMHSTSDMDVLANWFEDCDGSSCRSQRHRLSWNRFAGGAVLKLEAGNMKIKDVAGMSNPTKRPRARKCVLIGNRSRTMIGAGAVVGWKARNNSSSPRRSASWSTPPKSSAQPMSASTMATVAECRDGRESALPANPRLSPGPRPLGHAPHQRRARQGSRPDAGDAAPGAGSGQAGAEMRRRSTALLRAVGITALEQTLAEWGLEASRQQRGLAHTRGHCPLHTRYARKTTVPQPDVLLAGILGAPLTAAAA